MALIPKGGMVGLAEVLILGYGFAEIGPLRSNLHLLRFIFLFEGFLKL